MDDAPEGKVLFEFSVVTDSEIIRTYSFEDSAYSGHKTALAKARELGGERIVMRVSFSTKTITRYVWSVIDTAKPFDMAKTFESRDAAEMWALSHG